MEVGVQVGVTVGMVLGEVVGVDVGVSVGVLTQRKNKSRPTTQIKTYAVGAALGCFVSWQFIVIL